MDFNINKKVRVKLTDHGRAVHAADHGLFWDSVPQATRPQYTPPREDAEGWSEWQLWSLMKAFGPHIYLGGPEPFETTIQVVEPKPYVAPPQDPMAAVRAMCG